MPDKNIRSKTLLRTLQSINTGMLDNLLGRRTVDNAPGQLLAPTRPRLAPSALHHEAIEVVDSSTR